MIRLLAVLGVFLFMALWFLGADHGQYINPPRARPAVQAAAGPENRPVFIPARPQGLLDQSADTTAADPPPGDLQAAPPLAEAPATAEDPAPDPAAEPASEPAAEPAALPPPVLPGIRLMRVPVGASVRAGPGGEFALLGDLSPGDVVLVVDDSSAPGWMRIRVDGRGEGWVAASLLRE